MKKRNYLSILAAGAICAGLLLSGCSSGDGTAPSGSTSPAPEESTAPESSESVNSDQAAADNVSALIDAIYVQQRTEDTDAQCAAAKEAWDALTDAQKELVSDPDYFGRDTGDASLDDPPQSGRHWRERAAGGELRNLLQ